MALRFFPTIFLPDLISASTDSEAPDTCLPVTACLPASAVLRSQILPAQPGEALLWFPGNL